MPELLVFECRRCNKSARQRIYDSRPAGCERLQPIMSTVDETYRVGHDAWLPGETYAGFGIP